MLSARAERLLQSSSFRLAAIYAGLLIISFLLAGAGVWVTTQTAAERQIRERVQLEMNALQEEMRIEGMTATITAIDTRAESPGALEYRLTDRSGALLAGNLPLHGEPRGWHAVQLPDPREAGRRDNFIIL